MDESSDSILEAPLNPTPLVNYGEPKTGSRQSPLIIAETHGPTNDSRILHTAEDDKFYQYTIRNVKKNDGRLSMYKLCEGKN